MSSSLRQDPTYQAYQRSLGWRHHRLGSAKLAYRHLPFLLRPIGKFQHAPLPPLAEIERLAKKLKLRRLYLEPETLTQNELDQLTQAKFKYQTQPFLPTQTILIDLKPSLEEIKAQFHKKTRACLRQGLKSSLTIKSGTSPQLAKIFHRTWKKTAGFRLIIPSQKNFLKLVATFGPQANLNLAFQKDKPVAGNLILRANQTAYYYSAFTNQLGREKMAGYRLVWEAVRGAKKEGCSWFDLEGIFDPLFPQKSWQGFSHFKKSFGGKLITYPGCWAKKYPLIPKLRK